MKPGEHYGKPFAKMECYANVWDAILNKDMSRKGKSYCKSFYKTKETLIDIYLNIQTMLNLNFKSLR